MGNPRAIRGLADGATAPSAGNAAAASGEFQEHLAGAAGCEQGDHGGGRDPAAQEPGGYGQDGQREPAGQWRVGPGPLPGRLDGGGGQGVGGQTAAPGGGGRAG